MNERPWQCPVCKSPPFGSSSLHTSVKCDTSCATYFMGSLKCDGEAFHPIPSCRFESKFSVDRLCHPSRQTSLLTLLAKGSGDLLLFIPYTTPMLHQVQCTTQISTCRNIACSPRVLQLISLVCSSCDCPCVAYQYYRPDQLQR